MTIETSPGVTKRNVGLGRSTIGVSTLATDIAAAFEQDPGLSVRNASRCVIVAVIKGDYGRPSAIAIQVNGSPPKMSVFASISYDHDETGRITECNLSSLFVNGSSMLGRTNAWDAANAAIAEFAAANPALFSTSMAEPVAYAIDDFVEHV